MSRSNAERGLHAMDMDVVKSLDVLQTSTHYVEESLKDDANFPEMFNYFEYGVSLKYLNSDNEKNQGWSATNALTPSVPGQPLTVAAGDSLPFLYSPFDLVESLNIPDEIFLQFNSSNISSQMGIFPEISRAWIAIDSRLYFWSFQSSSKNDFQLFEELHEAIVAVKLIKPKKDTFVASVNYLLVIATTDDIYLVAVSYDSKTNALELYDSGMSVSIAGLRVDQLAADNSSGRIFFTGKNTHCNVYEVVYNSTDSWFRSKCTKIIRTNTGIGPGILSNGIRFLWNATMSSSSTKSSAKGTTSGTTNSTTNSATNGSTNSSTNSTNSSSSTPFSASTAEAVAQLKIDDTRSLIYTLSNKHTIRVYAMISGSEELREIGSIDRNRLLGQVTNLKTRINHSELFGTSFTSTGPAGINPNDKLYQVIQSQIAGLDIVSVEPISSKQSESVYFVAISSKGVRFYFTASSSSTVFTQRSASFSCYHIRPSPACVNRDVPLDGGAESSARLLSPHYFFAPFTNPSSNAAGNKLLCCALDTLFYSTNNQGDFEVYDLLPVEGYIKAIETISRMPFSASDKPLGFSNEAGAQYTVPPTKVAVLTSTGLFIYQRVYPQTVFERTIYNPKVFYDFYGASATCASALAYACTGSLDNESLRSLATQTFVDFSEAPSYVRPSKHQSAAYFLASGSCQGYATYLSRIIRLNWDHKVFNISQVKNTIKNDSGDVVPTGTTRTNISLTSSREQLEILQQRLMELLRFFDANRAIIKGLETIPQDVNMDSEKETLWMMEHRTLNGLLQLTRSIYEGISFLLLMVEETMSFRQGINAALDHLSQDTLKELNVLTFKSFFSESKGREIAKDLVTCLMNLNISRGGSVSEISKILQDRCESYCSPNDVLLYKASECLRKAKINQNNLDVKVMNLYDSLALFKEGASGLTPATLQEAVQEFLILDFFQGAVEICLTVAQNVGSRFDILQYIKAGKPEGDYATASSFEHRLDIYKLIFGVLDSADQKSEGPNSNEQLRSLRNNAYNICFFCDDEIFHYCFYDWFFERQQEARLMDVDTPFLLGYLTRKAEDDVRYADMMWVYCQKRGDYLTAATQLFKLASSQFEIPLEERIEYLSRAKTYCSSASDPAFTRELNELSSQIEDFTVIATIQDDLLREVKNDDRLSDEEKALPIKELSSTICDVSILFNKYASPMGYYDICLACFKVSDYRDATEITDNWNKLLSKVASQYEPEESYKHIATVVQRLGLSFLLSESVFPLPFLVEYLETFYYQICPNAPHGWIAESLLNAGVKYEPIYSILLDLLDRTEYPFSEPDCKELICKDIINVLTRWIGDARPHHVLQHVTVGELAKLNEFDRNSVTLIKRRLGL